MEINNNQYSNMNFKARSSEIRKLNDIMRRTNQNYPRLSTYKMEKSSYSYENKYYVVISKLFNKLKSYRRIFVEDEKSKLDHTAQYVKDIKLGNCLESAVLAEIALITNGIKDAKMVRLCTREVVRNNGSKEKYVNSYSGLDHGFVIFNLDKEAKLNDPRTYGKKAMIMDPAMDFVDYVPNAFLKYASEFNVNRTVGKQSEIISKTEFCLSEESMNKFKIDDKLIKDFQNKYPNLIHKKQ